MTSTRFGPALGLAIAVALASGGCEPAIPTSSSGPPASFVSVEPSTGPSSPPTTPPTGQTDTDWGRIWDALPATFPVYPGAVPAAEAATGPVSAILAVEGPDPRTVATWTQTELERAAYRTEALTGPLEDGSFVLESVGAEGCRVEVAVASLGSLTTVTVRYGAACPGP